MVVPENQRFQCAADFDIPIQHHRIRQIVYAQPDGEAPVEWLAINQTERALLIYRHQDVIPVYITVNKRETCVILCSLYHPAGMCVINPVDGFRPLRFQFVGTCINDEAGLRYLVSPSYTAIVRSIICSTPKVSRCHSKAF